jgi:hypothetical protein
MSEKKKKKKKKKKKNYTILESALTNFKNLQLLVLRFSRQASLHFLSQVYSPLDSNPLPTPVPSTHISRFIFRSTSSLSVFVVTRIAKYTDAVTLEKLQNSTPLNTEIYDLRDQKKRNISCKLPKNIPASCLL